MLQAQPLCLRLTILLSSSTCKASEEQTCGVHCALQTKRFVHTTTHKKFLTHTQKYRKTIIRFQLCSQVDYFQFEAVSLEIK